MSDTIFNQTPSFFTDEELLKPPVESPVDVDVIVAHIGQHASGNADEVRLGRHGRDGDVIEVATADTPPTEALAETAQKHRTHHKRTRPALAPVYKQFDSTAVVVHDRNVHGVIATKWMNLHRANNEILPHD